MREKVAETIEKNAKDLEEEIYQKNNHIEDEEDNEADKLIKELEDQAKKTKKKK